MFYCSLLLSLWVSVVSPTCGLTFVISRPRMFCICPWFVRSMIFRRVTLLLISSTRRVLLCSANSTVFALLFVVPAHIVRLCAMMWSFSASTSSCFGSTRSLSPVVLNCLLVVVFLFQRCGLSFVVSRLAYEALGYWMFPLCLLCLLPVALRHRLLHRILRGPLLRYPATFTHSSGSGLESWPGWPRAWLSSPSSVHLL